MGQIQNLLTQNMDLLFLALVFICAVILCLFFMNFMAGAADLRRRATSRAGSGAGGASVSDIPDNLHPILRSSTGALKKSRGLASGSEADRAHTKRVLELAGFYGQSAPFIYQFSRIVASVFLGIAALFICGKMFPNLSFFMLIFCALAMTYLGFYLPRLAVAWRRKSLCDEHRRGFPDFLDLLVICTEAGVGIDAAVDRVSKDIYLSHPSLSRNLFLMTLELRAGRALKDALANLAVRLGIDEAKSFATLLQQSEELGSSLVDSLRVYSDEMRSKRLARAEEKAQALPAKLVFPLGFCVFPVILTVTIFPVAIRIYKGLGL